ncbi:hypothetical protein DVDV_2467 [Desulfovibrio sp. DV]|nr:hypothetical protein DVDV_2467 [Desulfovibrio sp. DV]
MVRRLAHALLFSGGGQNEAASFAAPSRLRQDGFGVKGNG